MRFINSLWNSARGTRYTALDSLPPTPCQYVTQLNDWSKQLRLTEIKCTSLSTKYSCSRWCNKICVLSILSEILGGGQDKPTWTACPPPLVNKKPNWMFEVIISNWHIYNLGTACNYWSVADNSKHHTTKFSLYGRGAR